MVGVLYGRCSAFRREAASHFYALRALGKKIAAHQAAISYCIYLSLDDDVNESSGDYNHPLGFFTVNKLQCVGSRQGELFKLFFGSIFRHIQVIPLLAVDLIIQVNGKKRDNLDVPKDASKEELEKLALAAPNAVKFIDGKEPKRVIVVPGRLVNIVI